MLIYGVSGTFAHKKTIKQFLQLTIEQVFWGGGGKMCREDVPLFWVSFSEVLCFCVGFFNSPMPFWGVDFTNICIFCCILCVFHQKVKQCFGHKIFLIYNRPISSCINLT